MITRQAGHQLDDTSRTFTRGALQFAGSQAQLVRLEVVARGFAKPLRTTRLVFAMHQPKGSEISQEQNVPLASEEKNRL